MSYIGLNLNQLGTYSSTAETFQGLCGFDLEVVYSTKCIVIRLSYQLYPKADFFMHRDFTASAPGKSRHSHRRSSHCSVWTATGFKSCQWDSLQGQKCVEVRTMYQILVSSLCTSHVLSKCFEAQKFFISAIMKTEFTFSKILFICFTWGTVILVLRWR